MPLGKQAAAYTLASSFPDSCGKVQDAPPNPFSVFFPPALSIGFAFINTTPTFCKRSGSFVFPSHSGLGRRTGPLLSENTPVHNGRVSPRRGKNLLRLPGCPAIAPGGLGKLLGLGFLMQSGIQNTTPTFFLRWELLCFPFPAGLGEKMGPPLCKNALVHNGRAGPCRGKISRAFRIVPPSPRAVWESSWGLVFSCNPKYKTLLPPFLSPAGAGMKK